MKTEPDISAADLMAHLHGHYELDLSKVAFQALGEGAWCYLAEGDGRWFVRLGKRPIAAGVLELMARLGREGFPVIPLVPTKHGDLASALDVWQLTVQPWFDGSSLMARNGDKRIWHERVGELTARLHGTIEGASIPVEDFSRHQHATREILSAGVSGGFLALREAMRDKIEQVLYAAGSLGARLRDRGYAPVVCHGDLHDDNVLMADDGEIRIIDWDGATLAPRERDLMFFIGDDWESYMRGYGGEAANRDILDYYILEWALQEVVDYGGRILFDDRFDASGRADALRQFTGLFDQGGDVDRALQLIRS